MRRDPLKAFLVLIGLLGGLAIDACSFGHQGTSGDVQKFSHIYVNISSLGDARVAAVLIDHEKRRTGWNLKGPVREIPGCWDEYGSDEGIPNEYGSEDTTAEGATEDSINDTLAVKDDLVPIYHLFTILSSSLNDSTNTPGLIPEGGCELQLDPIYPGRVSLAITGSGSPDSGIGQDACKDTASVLVTAGEPSNWRLSWNADGNKCVVKLSKLSTKRMEKHKK